MYPVEHIWTILMLKILQAHLLPAFVANSKIDAIYALYLESFCDKILLSGKFSLFLTLCAFSNYQHDQVILRIAHICVLSPHCV